MNINLLEWITMMNGLFEKMKVGGSDDEVLLGHKIAFMRTGLEISLIQCGYLAHRAEVQVQAVSMIESSYYFSLVLTFISVHRLCHREIT